MMKFRRVEGWWPALQTVMREYEGKSWRWGASDCACLAADAIKAQTGIDCLEAYRGRYASLWQARKLTAGTIAGGTFKDVLGSELEFRGAIPCDPRFCGVGDIGFADGVALVRMPNGFVARARDGKFRLTNASMGWILCLRNNELSN